jgi:hypothetical protein
MTLGFCPAWALIALCFLLIAVIHARLGRHASAVLAGLASAACWATAWVCMGVGG